MTKQQVIQEQAREIMIHLGINNENDVSTELSIDFIESCLTIAYYQGRIDKSMESIEAESDTINQ